MEAEVLRPWADSIVTAMRKEERRVRSTRWDNDRNASTDIVAWEQSHAS